MPTDKHIADGANLNVKQMPSGHDEGEGEVRCKKRSEANSKGIEEEALRNL